MLQILNLITDCVLDLQLSCTRFPQKNKTPPKKATNMMASFLKKGAENPAPPVVPEKKPSVKPVAGADSSEDETKPETTAAQKSVRFGAKKTASRAVVAKKRSDRGGGEARSKKRRRILAVASDSSGSSEDEGEVSISGNGSHQRGHYFSGRKCWVLEL